ncbi:MAG: formylglycine-generating enzyme family protein, partial [Candidatus Competibacteraceae bacterium]|nr:formylglycine-generating enzyme family protein [Candidatus Competibacteraceae bacterium]
YDVNETRDARLYGDDRVWAAALALGGDQANADGAHRLRLALNLAASPWLADRIMAVAKAEPGPLITWLLRCEPPDDNGFPATNSLVWQALNWWRKRYAEGHWEMARQQRPLLPWQSTLARDRWRIDEAILQLYREPGKAADRLTALASKELKGEIRARLSGFADAAAYQALADRPQHIIYTTWRLADVEPLTQYRLRALGFAGGIYRKAPPPLARYPWTLQLTLGALGGLALVAFGAAIKQWQQPNYPELMPQNQGIARAIEIAPTLALTEELDNGQYRITVGSARKIASQEVPAGARVQVVWRWGQGDIPGQQAITNAITPFDNSASVVLRAGTLAQPIRPCDPAWPKRALAVIAASYTDNAPARQLAIRLLDRGSADQVLIGTDWRERLKDWLGPSRELNQNTQLLVILPAPQPGEPAVLSSSYGLGQWAIVSSPDFAALAHELGFAASKNARIGFQPSDPHLVAIDTIFADRIHRKQGQVRVIGGAARGSSELPNLASIEWVRVCPGTFTLGVLDNEQTKGSKDLDKLFDPPGHTVVLPGYEISATEITEGQYATLQSKRVPVSKNPDLPRIELYRWDGVRKACQKAGGDLPTEAQWEYAARGGSRASWSFGELDDYAWYNGNSGNRAQLVGQKAPNPLGLYDIHGNVWEWTRDWYGDYPAVTDVPLIDPDGAISGERRVLRGGSFANSPGVLRSALRVGGRNLRLPRSEVLDVGFRCVRVPPPH